MSREHGTSAGALASIGAVGLFGGWLVAVVTRPLPIPFRLAALAVCLVLLVRRSR
ncbi:hypothetical protein OG401_15265 [Kitasatospora purpeofusca]|uniref:hypothetical protein n=1 Tax=Kitasatospora purpeofusca TaxID=67352 RepID=UPI00224E2457|nr:hypothetical protein [Kitasatospora purpeofusca]MCX4685650.1 hypothetical protein [Kitasatospora purpeofusca]